MLEAYEQHQDLPFEQLVQTLEREGQIKRKLSVPGMFLFHPALPPPLELTSLTLHALDFKEMENTVLTPTTFDLIFTLSEKPEGLTGSLVYKIGSLGLTYSTINRMLGHFQQIVEQINSTP